MYEKCRFQHFLETFYRTFRQFSLKVGSVKIGKSIQTVEMEVKIVLLFLVLVLGRCNSSFLKTLDKGLTAAATESPDYGFIGLPDLSSTTEENSLEAPDHPEYTQTVNDEETQAIEIELRNGFMFRLMMTVIADWNEDFNDITSATFKQLASKLGSELADFVGEKLELNVANVTNFKLVEVQPRKDSSEIYVTFVVLSTMELVGEDLSNVISNQINLYERINEYKASIDEFTMENLSEKDAHQYKEEWKLLESGK